MLSVGSDLPGAGPATVEECLVPSLDYGAQQPNDACFPISHHFNWLSLNLIFLADTSAEGERQDRQADNILLGWTQSSYT